MLLLENRKGNPLMDTPQKPPTEVEMLDWLENLGAAFAPVKVRLTSRSPTDSDADALVDVTWQNQRFRFTAELKSGSTPKAILAGIEQAKRWARPPNTYPLLITPYLSEENLKWLEDEEISGLDLSGNGLLQIPGILYIRKSGAPNSYPRGMLIQNVYRGASSQVARCFLLQPEYKSTQALLAELRARGAAVTLSTVSKVCSRMEEDLVIERIRLQRSVKLRLLQPEKLLDALAKNFELPAASRRYIGKCALEREKLIERLTAWQTHNGHQVVRTGADSTTRYATMAREPVSRFYCTKLGQLLNFFGAELSETSRFPNIEFIETQDATAYFDSREDLFASPIQCYLELQAGDKRDQETADQVRRALLKPVPRRTNRA
jgi:hypothetical protein